MYLTPDSQDTLEELDPQKVYIIGGLVDRNRHKGLCQSKADKQGIKSAKLPIEQHLKLAGTRVLTVNQTAAILIHWLVSLSTLILPSSSVYTLATRLQLRQHMCLAGV